MYGGIFLIQQQSDPPPPPRHVEHLSGRCAGGRFQGFGGGGAGVWSRGCHDGRDPRRGGNGDGHLLVPRAAWGVRG